MYSHCLLVKGRVSDVKTHLQATPLFCVAIWEKDRQSTYNVISKRVLVTIVAVEKQQVLHILSARS